MIVGHFDDSGLDAKSESLWLAGYVGRIDVWFEFSRVWRQALAKRSVAALHTTDLVNSRGEFKGWTADDQATFLDELISIMNSSDILGVGAGVVKLDYERLVVNSGFLAEVGLPAASWNHPYLLVFQQLVVEAVLKAEELPRVERVSFIFEQQDTYASRCRDAFAGMADSSIWPRADRLGSVDFKPKAECIPLQAADLLVYELRKRLDHQLTQPARTVRRSMDRLRKRLISSPYMTAAELPSLMEELRASRAAARIA